MPTSYSEIDKLRDYSTLFSRKHCISWLESDFEALHSRIKLYDPNISDIDGITYLAYIKKVYKEIKHKYPNEYVIKNSFINDFLIHEIRSSNAIVCNEFKVGKSKADLAIFNGISKAFEIKSEFDSPIRLKSQLIDYKKIFNQVYLIVPSSKIEMYMNFDSTIGVISFSKNKSDKFKVIKKATTNTKLKYEEIINVLRSKEYIKLVEQYYGEVPIMTSFNQYEICKELISKIPSIDLNRLFVSIIKERKDIAFLQKRKYKELNQLSLALKLSKIQHNKIINNLKELIKT